MSKSMGAVPKAKIPMIKLPWIGLPDNSAKLWAVMVNPQGRKNVKAPITKGMYFPLKLFSFAIFLVMNFGIENWNFLNARTPSI